jgi:hypothetical protein
MKLSWRDMLATIVALCGAVVVFAKLRSYSWWLIGSWKGALGVMAVLGLAVAGLYAIDWVSNQTMAPLGEMFLWGMAAVTIFVSLFASTTKAEFIWSATLLGVAWLVQLTAHAWDTTHNHTSHMVSAR